MTIGQIIMNGDYENPIPYNGLPVPHTLENEVFGMLMVADERVFFFWSNGLHFGDNVQYEQLGSAVFHASNIIAVIGL